MFHFLVGRRRKPINLLFITTINLGNKFLLLHHPLHLHHKSLDEVEAKPIHENHSSSLTTTVSYLINSCGLSPQSALTTSKKISIKSTKTPDSNLALFKSHGFSDNQITKLISGYPPILLSKWVQTVKPKFDYFISLGYSKPDVATLFCSNQELLQASLQRRLKPNFDLLRCVFSTSQQLALAVCRSARLLTVNLEANFLPDIRILQGCGVPASNITRLTSTFPRRVNLSTARFKTTIESLRKMGFDPQSIMFVYGVIAISGIDSSAWERKLAFYKSMGWSEAEFLSAFKKRPTIVLRSDETIKRVMDFAAHKLNWGPSIVAAQPVLLTYSLEKRIVPRFSVMSLLVSKGLTLRTESVYFLSISETNFLNKYVMKYQDQVPELLETYKGNFESIDK